MSKAKMAVLLLVILILGMSVTACGFTSQGSQEQNRPAESQNAAEEDRKEANKNVAPEMEETGKEEETERGKEAEK